MESPQQPPTPFFPLLKPECCQIPAHYVQLGKEILLQRRNGQGLASLNWLSQRWLSHPLPWMTTDCGRGTRHSACTQLMELESEGQAGSSPTVPWGFRCEMAGCEPTLSIHLSPCCSAYPGNRLSFPFPPEVSSLGSLSLH